MDRSKYNKNNLNVKSFPFVVAKSVTLHVRYTEDIDVVCLFLKISKTIQVYQTLVERFVDSAKQACRHYWTGVSHTLRQVHRHF